MFGVVILHMSPYTSVWRHMTQLLWPNRQNSLNFWALMISLFFAKKCGDCFLAMGIKINVNRGWGIIQGIAIPQFIWGLTRSCLSSRWHTYKAYRDHHVSRSWRFSTIASFNYQSVRIFVKQALLCAKLYLSGFIDCK